MANYIINQCLTNEQFVIYAEDTLTEGTVIQFGEGENLFCGIVVEETEDSVTPSYYYNFAEFADCCECLSVNTESLNFSFIRCDDSESVINIEATEFCSEVGLPTINSIYEIQFGFETPFCATFVGLSQMGTTHYSYVSGPFSLCEDCGEDSEPPRSANTENFVCIPECGFTGSTSVAPPHPVWTDGYGTSVTQLNMVVLGGPNGLNG